MTRQPREVSPTGFYHVVIRGNGKQVVFEDEDDRRIFLHAFSEAVAKTKIEVIAWCLMSNHAHFCLYEDPSSGLDEISSIMQRIQTSYAKWFNGKTGHAGNVFEARFASMAIKDERYLLKTVRYIHNNPEKAGIASHDAYRWSSYGEYVGSSSLCNTKFVLELVGGTEGFIDFSATGLDEPYRFSSTKRLTDEEALNRAEEVLGGKDPALLKAMSKAERNRWLCELRAAGIMVKQLVRLTGLGSSTIIRATKK